MDIPIDVRLPICIEQGVVVNFSFLGQDPKAEMPKNRYFVVVNANPKTDSVIILVTSTTQVAKKIEYIKRTGLNAETVVTVTPAEFAVFSKETAFNCNDVYEYSLDELVKKVEESGSMNYPKLPTSITNKIIAGIKASPKVRNEVKKLM